MWKVAASMARQGLMAALLLKIAGFQWATTRVKIAVGRQTTATLLQSQIQAVHWVAVALGVSKANTILLSQDVSVHWSQDQIVQNL